MRTRAPERSDPHVPAVDNVVASGAHEDDRGGGRCRRARAEPRRGAGAGRTPVAPPTTITTPPRDFGPGGAPTTYFTDPDILTVEPEFNGLRQPNTPIQRLWTGAMWSEGPAWSSQGRYLVWSDIPNNRQMRWLEDDGRVTVFRTPVEQQQRQHVRLPGPPALVRAPHAPRGPLRERRLDHAHRRQVQRQAPELTERRRAASRRQLLVHRSAVRWPALRGRAGRGGRAEQRAGPAQEPPGSGARDRRQQARAADRHLSRRSERAGGSGRR